MNLYQNFFTLLQDNIFGGVLVQGSAEYLVATALSVAGVGLVVAIPFIVVRMIFGIIFRG